VRIACVLLPRFALAVELLGRPELRGRPVVLGGAPEERKLVVECSPAAARFGIRRDTPLREALTRCRDAVFLESRPRVYIEAFGRMLDALEHVSPVVEGVRLGCAFVDLTGLPGVAGTSGERQVAETLQRAVKGAVLLTPRIGIADTRVAAWVAASGFLPEERRGHTAAPALRAASNRHRGRDTQAKAAGPAFGAASRVHIIAPDEAATFLMPLPGHRLPLSEEMQRRLRWLGVRTAGDLAALSRAELAAQFGPEGGEAWDLVHGVGDGPLVPRHREPEVSARVEFDQPVTDAAAIITAARHLLGRLLTGPACAGHALRGIEVQAALAGGHTWQRIITFREPVTDQNRMIRALAERLEGTAFPAALEALELSPRGVCAEAGAQGSLFSARARHLHNLSAALEHLHARFDRPLVMKIVGVEPWSRIPERQYALIACEPSTLLGRYA
jgi:DNA polymerase-4/protein ImuB